MAEPVVAANELSRRFGPEASAVYAVRDATLALHEGELVVLLGRSGAGKSTLLTLVGGLDRPDRGRVLVQGRDVAAMAGAGRDRFLRETVGWVFQASGLLPLLSATENVAIALRLLGKPPAEALAEAARALAAVGLEARAGHRGNELSGGEQQRVALARALVKAPSVLLADEPTAQLDSETALTVTRLVRHAADSGTAVLFATHDEAVTEFADRVVRIDDGVLGPG